MTDDDLQGGRAGPESGEAGPAAPQARPSNHMTPAASTPPAVPSSIADEVAKPRSERALAASTYQAGGARLVVLHGVNPKTGIGCTCSKGSACRSVGKHARFDGWQQAGPMTEAEIDEAWPLTGFRSTSNVGIATGEASGWWVLDLDPDKGGLESAKRLRDEHPVEWDETTIVRTGSGGFHYRFQLPADFEVTNSPGALKGAYPGIDVRGNGGLVVVPPSVTDKGDYRFVNDAPAGRAPDFLLDKLRPKERPERPASPVAGDVAEGEFAYYFGPAAESELARLDAMQEAATPGRVGYRGENWDDTSFEVACAVQEIANTPGSGLSLDYVREQFLARALRDDDFGPEEHLKCWESAVKKVAGKTRSVPVSLADEIADWDIPCEQVVPVADADFWDERPILRHIRDFAHARMCSALAVLGVVMARVIAVTPPHVVLPPIIGSDASLNLFVALVGESGTGKGAAESAAQDAVDVGMVETATPGSGEGIGHMFAHREKGEVVRDRNAVLFTAPEVDGLAAVSQERRGSTLMPQLRSAWSGEDLGFAYADRNKALPIRRHTYRLGLLVGVQPGRAAPLLEDSDGGTPQRFVWLPTTDPSIPERAVAPEPMHLGSQVWPAPSKGLFPLAVPEVAEKTIRAARLARMRGEGDPLDGHALLCRLKVAAALCLLDGRRVVTDDDWRLAGVLMEASSRTRRGVQQHLSKQASRANLARGKAEGERAAVAEETVSDAAVTRVARRVALHLSEHGEGPRNDARKRLPSRDRQHYDEAVERLVAAGQVEVLTTPHGERLRPVGGAT